MSGGPWPAVVTALREELAPLLTRGRAACRLATAGGRFYRLELGGRHLVAGFTGDGALCAADGLRALLDEIEVGSLLLMGVAGGLSPELGVGDLMPAREVRDASGTAPPPDEVLGERAAALDVAAGVLVSSARIATTPQEKASLWRASGSIRPAAVDLETAAWARVAAERGVPYTAVRAISDRASDALPLDFNLFQDARGRVRRGRIVAHVLRRPWMIPSLVELGRRTQRCGERLADFVETFVR